MFKPLACEGCPCYGWEGFALPTGTGANGVLLLGEALGATEAEVGRPFAGKAGFVLDKLLRHAGFTRDDFWVMNAVNCRPPANKLEGTPLEFTALGACRDRHLTPFLRRVLPKVVVPLGNVATYTLLGSKQVLSKRGFVWFGAGWPMPILPTVHPSFIMRGNGAYGTVFIRDIQRAVEVGANGYRPAAKHYLLDPIPLDALRWVEGYESALARNPHTLLAYDIETPFSDEEKEEGSLGEDASYTILRIGFAYQPYGALSIPWRGEYLPIIRRLFASAGAKVVWNDSFDTPRVRAAGVVIGGTIHDGMVAWHVLNSDLPKRLAFVASMLLDDQPAWKHLNKKAPAFYNATDADVEVRATAQIFELLRVEGLWNLYERHIVRLFPLLARLSVRGMPVDACRRERFAQALSIKQIAALDAMVAAVPLAARKVAHVYKPGFLPAADSQLHSRPAVFAVPVCTKCGHRSPAKPHFRVFKRPTPKRPQNPCASAATAMLQVEGTEWYRLADWRPSKEQLLTYAKLQGHNPIKRRDGDHYKVTFDEDAIRKMMLRYPDDNLYPKILAYRELDKLAGTYIGRPYELEDSVH